MSAYADLAAFISGHGIEVITKWTGVTYWVPDWPTHTADWVPGPYCDNCGVPLNEPVSFCGHTPLAATPVWRVSTIERWKR